MVKISEDKIGTIAENIEKGLRYVGKAMQCIDELQGGGYGERSGYGMREGDMNYRYPMMHEEMGMRGGYGYGERDDIDYRRGRDSMGRYTRM